MDVSYNNFLESSVPPTCRETLNLFKTFSGQGNTILGECLKRFPCSEVKYSLHINCGGKSATFGDIQYEADEDPGGAAKFVPVRNRWGFSGTSSDHIATNVLVLKMNNSELYTSARLSPLSLTYYARCLENGNYTVRLHFAEIQIRGNKSYQSLGTRIFDVCIQENLELKFFGHYGF
ncbi:putative Leucine-rich repeat transmembrane protein kinase [Quillaja saponaria]|uniref:Leucine-rich repeat transmembrane protein kinase n=1 Tax=Quillaja saponaria TaxID=32244 RepID=A0AAD7PA19_QUISA|nr:putative Leucine-rich repeat transmembrane protein kinase [Quillaja saponaria]